MRRKPLLLAFAAAFAALALAAPPALALSVTSVNLAVSPAASKGPCPVQFTFTGKITLNGRGEFRYKWERSDGAVDATGPHTAAYDGVHPTIVTETWTLGAALPAFHPFNGWVTLHVLAPSDQSSSAKFTLDCGAPPEGGQPRPGLSVSRQLEGGNLNGPLAGAACNGKPDLVPLLHSPFDGWVGVKNIGTGNAGPSVLRIKCRRDGKKGGYPCEQFGAAEFVTPPFFVVGWSWVGLSVPGLACGGEFVATMPGWANLALVKGGYTFTAFADWTNVVAESNEGNNETTSTMVKP